MKKFFSFAAALFFGLSAMAVEPTLEATGWTADPATAFGDVFKTHECGVTLTTDQTAWKGNLSGHMYVVSGGGTDWTSSPMANWVGVSANNKIDSIAILWAPNGTNVSSIAWIGWESGVTPSAEVGTNYGVGADYTATKSWDAAKWETFDFSAKDLTTIYFSRQWKKVQSNNSVIGNFGGNQTINFLGFKVWVSGQAGATKYTVTYMNGETVLGSERVAAGATPTNYSNYETVAGSEFQGWFEDAALTIPANFTTAINADKAFYGKFFHVASSAKAVNEIIMSNGYSAWQAVDDPTIHAYYLQGESAPSIQSYIVSEAATAVVAGMNLTVTAENGDDTTYTVVAEAVAPLTFTTDTIVLDGSESWIKGGYGFDATKKWRFSKTDTDYSREWTGKTHIELFLPACDTVYMLESCGQSRDIRVYANNVQVGDKVKQVSRSWSAFAVEQSEPFMLTIKSAQTGGDGGIAAIVMKKDSTPTSIDVVEESAQKVIVNGQLVIIRDGVRYNAMGAVIE